MGSSRLINFPGKIRTPEIVGTKIVLPNISTPTDSEVGIYGGFEKYEIYNKEFDRTDTHYYAIRVITRSNVYYFALIREGNIGVVKSVENKSYVSRNWFLIEEGANLITYYYGFYGGPYEYTAYTTETFTIYGVENKYPLKPWTNQSVIDRVLQLAEPLRKGETPRFTFNPVGLTERELNAFAPEYTFTRMNLREVMQTIGGTIHAEPRLKLTALTENERYAGEWRFDKLGGTALATYTNWKTGAVKPLNQYKYTTYKRSHDIEQACTRLDSYMDNLVNRITWQDATISKPSEYVPWGSRLRTESAYIRFSEDSEQTYYHTEYPIDRLERFECVYRIESSGDVRTVNLTPFIFEKQVYNNLSSYAETYQNSKSYALYYAQGEKGVKGFFYLIPNATGGVGVAYSIVNILESAGADLDELRSDNGNIDYGRIEFRISYVPIYSTRVQHGKQYLSDYLPTGRTVNYAQSDNSVETRFFGENMKGAAQRLGTVEKYVTFVMRHSPNIPKAGALWDDEYKIATVQVSVLQDHFEITCGLSQHFNRKSKYIGADSHKRIYEVSEAMVQQRHSVHTDYIVVETPESSYYTSADSYEADYLYGDPPLENQLFMTPMAFDVFISTLSGFVYLDDGLWGLWDKELKAQSMYIKGYSLKGAELYSYGITLACICSAFGNALEFTCETKDNFSAGLAMYYVTETNISGRFTTEVEYSDYYGRLYYLEWQLALDSNYPTDEDEQFYRDQASILPKDERETGNKGPLYTTTGGLPTLYRKDSREELKLSYLIETVAGSDELVIGSALQYTNALVTNSRRLDNTNSPLVPRLYTLKKKLGVFDEYLDEGDIAEDLGNVLSDTDNVEGGPFWKPLQSNGQPFAASEQNVVASKPAVAWVIAYPYHDSAPVTVENEDGTVEEEYSHKIGGEILIGRNMDIKAGDSGIGNFYIYALHDLQGYILKKKKEGKL